MKVLISSEHRISGTSSAGVIKLSNSINGTFCIESFLLTDRLYNVNDLNNKVYINSYNGATPSDHVLTLRNGFYSPTQLRDELAVQLNTISGNVYTVAYDTKKAKYTIAETSGDTFKFTFLDNSTNSSRKILGFSKSNTSYSTSHTSDLAIDLCPHKVIFLNFQEVDRKNIITTEHSHTDLYFTANSSFGSVIRWNMFDYSQIINFSKTPKELRYRFHNINNSNLDLNGVEWVLIMSKLEKNIF